MPSHFFVLVEGMFILLDTFGFEEVKHQMDITLFLNVPEEYCHQRVVERKSKGGTSKEDAEAHFQRVDKPNIQRVFCTQTKATFSLNLQELNQ